MMAPQRTALTLALALLPSLYLGASDFSAIVSTRLDAGGQVETAASAWPGYRHTNRLVLQGDLDLSQDMKLAASAWYQLAHDPASVWTTGDLSQSWDLAELYLSVDLAGSQASASILNLTVGRSMFYDFSTQVLAHKLDGIQLVHYQDGLQTRLGLGTSAGQFNASNGLLQPSADLASADSLFMSPSLILGQIEINKTDFLPGLNLHVSLLGISDVSVKLAWAGLGMDGSLTNWLYWSLSGWIQGGSTLSISMLNRTDLVVAGMGRGSLEFFVKPLANSRFTLGLTGSSGDGDLVSNQAPVRANVSGFNHFFTGISLKGGAYLYNSQHGNSLTAEAAWTAKPLGQNPGEPELSLGLHAYGWFRLVDGRTYGVLKAGTRDIWLGHEYDGSISLKALSDVVVSLKGGVFLPNPAALEQPASWKAGLELALSM